MSIKSLILDSIKTKLEFLKNENQINLVEKAGYQMIKALKKGNKVFIAGNGGSAADAQHFAAELSGKFVKQRKGLPAIALTTNSSNITAIGNDFGYEQIFVRQLESLCNEGDIFLGISTSGNSTNIVKAMEYAQQRGLITVGLLGNSGGRLKNFCDFPIIVPSNNTQNIQESHIMLIHILCAIIDEAF